MILVVLLLLTQLILTYSNEQFEPCIEGKRQCDVDIRYTRYTLNSLTNDGDTILDDYLVSIGRPNNVEIITFNEANQFCHNIIGTELAVITSEEDQQMAVEACSLGFDVGYNCWIGLHANWSAPFGKLSNGNDRDRQWTWIEDSGKGSLKDTKYTKWCKNEPSSAKLKSGNARNANESCVVLKATGICDSDKTHLKYGWDDTRCDGSASGALGQAVLCRNPNYDPDRSCLCDCSGCYIEGDPHVRTFDKLLYHPMNPCVYKYVTSCTGDLSSNDNGLPFEVSIRHQECFREDRTCIQQVIIKFFDENGDEVSRLLAQDTGSGTILVDHNGDTLTEGVWLCTDEDFRVSDYSNGDKCSDRSVEIKYSQLTSGDHQIFLMFTDKLPDSDGKIHRQYMDSRILITNKFGDTGINAWVQVHLSECFEEKTCGLCGRYDGNITNEWTSAGLTDTATVGYYSNSEFVSIVSDFRSISEDSWNSMNDFVDSYLDTDEVIKSDCTPPPAPPAPTCCYDRVIPICDCECEIDPEYSEQFELLCIIDLCALSDDLTQCTDGDECSLSELEIRQCLDELNYTRIVESICIEHCEEIEDTKNPTETPVKTAANVPTKAPTKEDFSCSIIYTSEEECDEDERCKWNEDNCICNSTVPIDAVFVLDKSGTVDSTEWELQTSFVDSLLSNGIAVDSRIGLIKFNNTVVTMHHLDSNIQSVRNSLDKNAKTGGQTATKSAIYAGIDMIVNNHANSGRDRLLFILTDGNPNPPLEESPLITGEDAIIKQTIDNENIQFIVVYIGDNINQNHLSGLIDSEDKQVIILQDFTDFENAYVREFFEQYTCPARNITTTESPSVTPVQTITISPTEYWGRKCSFSFNWNFFTRLNIDNINCLFKNKDWLLELFDVLIENYNENSDFKNDRDYRINYNWSQEALVTKETNYNKITISVIIEGTRDFICQCLYDLTDDKAFLMNMQKDLEKLFRDNALLFSITDMKYTQTIGDKNVIKP